MTVDELNQCLDAFRKKSGVLSLRFLVVFFTMLFSNVFLIHWLENHHPGYTWVSGLYMGCAFVIAGIFIWLTAKLPKQYLPQCPYCQVDVLPQHVPMIVATKNCTSCGRQMLEEVHALPDEEGSDLSTSKGSE